MKSATPRWHDGLLLAQLMGLLFLCLSYLRIAGDSQSMEFHDQVLDTLFAGPIWGTTLASNLEFFAFSLLLAHVLYATACWMLGRLSARAWPSATATRRQHVLLWFIVVTAGLLANNAAIYVTSSLGEPYADTMSVEILGVRLGRAIWIGVLVAAAATVLMAGLRWWREGRQMSRRGYATLTTVGIAYIAVSAHSILPTPAPNPSTKPNVILIGLDSLREDLLEKQFSPGVTPHIDAFMKRGVSFTNAITPLARTFPSMNSLLTGRHPHHTGAVMNLLPRNLIDDSESLPRVLGRAGYQTAYATDEVRFSNIDTTYGFGQAITPPIGASEFLISKLADTPVTNVLMNTRLGGWLFPHVHANRAAAVTYDPDAFVTRIERELKVQQPLFLTIHLTLGHWPYNWAGAPIKTRDEKARWPEYYLHAVQRVDQQFNDILEMLDDKGLLKNAIVVVYSDHGESFEAPHEALVPDEDPLIEALHLKPTWGHGTSVLTLHQYRIVLGMRHYSADWQPGREIAAPVTFEDVAPTVLEALGAATPAHFDGRSLLPMLEGRKDAQQSFDGRIRFTETEYQPQGIATQDGKISTSKIREAMSVYRLDRVTDRIEVRQTRLSELLIQRQYAAIGDHHLVAAFPSKSGSGSGSGSGFDYLVVALAGGEPRQLAGEPGADEPEVAALWTALHAEFGDVLKVSRNSLPTPTVANSVRTIPSSGTK